MTTVPMRFDDQPLLWWVDHLFSPAECAEMIAFIEKSAPTLATNNPIYRDQDRVMIDHPVLAADMFHRLQPHLPANMGELRLRNYPRHQIRSAHRCDLRGRYTDGAGIGLIGLHSPSYPGRRLTKIR